MKFYDCATAPSPRRVRLFLAEKGIDVESHEIDLRSGEQFSDSFRNLNPDCTVPVLELDDGTALTEIIAICQYLEDLHPEPRIMGRDAKEKALVLMWNAKVEQQGLAAIAEAFRNSAKGFRNRALTGPIDIAQLPELVERGLARATQFFDRLDAHLADQPYLAGENFTLADITGFVAVEFAAWLKIGIGDRQVNLQRWFDEVKQRPAMVASSQ
jgi:glutathione S-transferase